ncbi:MAG: M13 family metallopeptidase [Crocinitomicaceae bacterium]|nr:M13 family metallopeptidase [Crocinitomicaceae bacterium]
MNLFGKIIPIACSVALLLSCSTSKQQNKVDEVTVSENVKNNGDVTSFDVNYIDKSVRPQDDFFMYANGSWVKNNPVPSTESRWGSFNELEKSNMLKLTGILEDVSASKKGGELEANLGNYYTSFMDMENRNKLSWNVIAPDLNLVKSIKSADEIPVLIAKQHKNGIGSAFSFYVSQDLKEVKLNITYLEQGGLGLPNKNYYSDVDKQSIVDQYEKHIFKSFLLIGYTTNDARKAAMHVVSLERKLAAGMMSPAELRIPEDSYNRMSTDEFSNLMPGFNFPAYLKEVGSLTFKELVVGQPKYFSVFNELLHAESLATWKDYFSWKVIRRFSANLDEKFVNENFSFYQTVMTGKSVDKPMNEKAINEITNMSIGEILGKSFVEKYYSEKSQDRVNQMVDNLLIAFEERINGLAWMTKPTKEQALVKLHAIGRKLGYPNKWEEFKGLKLTRNEYVENIKRTSQWDLTKNLSELNEFVDREKWGMPAHMINAYYHPLLNEIAFPAGIMQAPFFDVNAEDAVNYGRIGMVIGHEFTHGFDDMGSKFAADGSFTNWWSEEDRKLFEARTLLLGNTFAGFCPIEGHCVNPDLTMGENIADLGGITLAYYAYKKTDEYKSGTKVNGFTPSQRFFISFAQLWKINYTEAEMKNRIANDPHSPGMYRVNGPLMNCPEFFEAFGVKEGDKMRNSEATISKIW